MTQQLFFSKAAAQRILSFATKIEGLKTFKNSIQITYRTEHGRCSTFLGKQAFYADFISFRQEGAKGCVVTPPMAGCYQTDYEVRSNRGEDIYTVRVMGPHAWCRCPDYKKQDQELGKAMPGCKHVLATLAYLGHGSLGDFVSAKKAEIEQKLQETKQLAPKTITARELERGNVIKHFTNEVWRVASVPQQTKQGITFEVRLEAEPGVTETVCFHADWEFQLLASTPVATTA